MLPDDQSFLAVSGWAVGKVDKPFEQGHPLARHPLQLSVISNVPEQQMLILPPPQSSPKFTWSSDPILRGFPDERGPDVGMSCPSSGYLADAAGTSR